MTSTAPAADPCCTLHVDGPVGQCCDPEDCGPCCPACPTCPTLGRMHPSMARNEDRPRSTGR